MKNYREKISVYVSSDVGSKGAKVNFGFAAGLDVSSNEPRFKMDITVATRLREPANFTHMRNYLWKAGSLNNKANRST